MNLLLSAGIFVLAYVGGRWALGQRLVLPLRRSALAYHTIAFTLGIALLTAPLVVVAVAGLFRVSWLGAFSWLVAAGLLVFAKSPQVGKRLDMEDGIALVAAALFIVAATAGRDEALGGGRDQQVYAEAAIALSERGDARARYYSLDNADRALLRDISGVVVPDVVDTQPSEGKPMTLSHPMGWPVWLAVANSIFGVEGIYAANSVAFALGGLLLFTLIRRITQSRIAVVVVILFFALPSSLWIAGVSLTEPPTMALLLALPLLSLAGANSNRWQIATILTAATLIRIDAALGVPAIIAATLFVGNSASSTAGRTLTRRFALTQFLAHLIALLAYWVFFYQYLRDLAGYVAVITSASLLLTLATLLLTDKGTRYVRHFAESRVFRLTVITFLAALFFYAALIRPSLPPFSIIQHGPPGLDGTRDFREDSVLNLATYVSWPILLAALGGAGYAIWNRWLTRGGLARPLIIALAVGPALLYLWFPHVSPDHPWAFRRFIPTVVPYSLLFAALFIHAFTRRIGPVGALVGALSLLVSYLLIVLNFDPQRLLIRENDGVTTQIAAIAKELPDGLVVATGVDQNIVAALLIAYGKQVAYIDADLARTDDFLRVSDWIEAKSKLGHTAWLLHGPEFWYSGANLAQEHKWKISRQFLAPSDRPPARSLLTQTSQLILTRATGLDRSFARRMFGGERVWGAPGRHFFDTEVASFGEFRYTDGFAWIDVPAEALRDAEALKVDIFSLARKGERRWLHVLIDQLPAWNGSVEAGVSTLRIPIPKLVTEDVTRITLLSEPIGRSDISSNDSRADLAIGLIGIRPLLPGEPLASGPGMSGFRSKLAIVEAGPGPVRVSTKTIGNFVLDVRNTGIAAWPTVREQGSPTGAVQIALRWYRREDPERFVGDNRWPMSISMLTGDHTRVKVPLAPIGLDGQSLPPGDYVVRVGMVRETVALFADNGDMVLSIPVAVTP